MTKVATLTLWIILIVMGGCSHDKKVSEEEVQLADTILGEKVPKKEEDLADTILLEKANATVKELKEEFDSLAEHEIIDPVIDTPLIRTEPFEILEITKSADYPSSDSDTTKCIPWVLTKTDIQKIIRDADTINGPEWHYLFSHLRCVISGTLIQNGVIYDYWMNGGAWFSVSGGGVQTNYGSFKKEHEHLFLTTVWEEEEEAPE